MGAGHDHVHTSNTRALAGALVLTGGFMLVEAVGGFLMGSLALLSDAMHMATDTFALVLALLALYIAKRPADAKRSFGYHRLEVLAAAFNALLLFFVAFYILYEAWQRIENPATIRSEGMLAIAVLGLVVNLISMKLLSAGAESSLNMKGAYLEVWSDMLGSLGVIAGALIIRFTGWQWVDSLIAVAIGIWVLPRTITLLRESLNVLMEGVPSDIDLPALESGLLAQPGVLAIHDLHVWSLASGRNSLSVHIVVAEHDDALRVTLAKWLQSAMGVSHVTLQMEVQACDSAACGLDTKSLQSHDHDHDHDHNHNHNHK